jgi:hypothetical protein
MADGWARLHRGRAVLSGCGPRGMGLTDISITPHAVADSMTSASSRRQAGDGGGAAGIAAVRALPAAGYRRPTRPAAVAAAERNGGRPAPSPGPEAGFDLALRQRASAGQPRRRKPSGCHGSPGCTNSILLGDIAPRGRHPRGCPRRAPGELAAMRTVTPQAQPRGGSGGGAARHGAREQRRRCDHRQPMPAPFLPSRPAPLCSLIGRRHRDQRPRDAGRCPPS